MTININKPPPGGRRGGNSLLFRISFAVPQTHNIIYIMAVYIMARIPISHVIIVQQRLPPRFRYFHLCSKNKIKTNLTYIYRNNWPEDCTTLQPHDTLLQ